MLSKIGIEDLDNKKFDYLFLQQKERFIDLPSDLKLKEIVSMMIILSIIETELIENKIYVKINIKTKMVYSLLDGKMKMLENDMIIIRSFELSYRENGFNLFELYNGKKIIFEVTLIYFSSSVLENNKIYINMYMVITAKYKLGYSLGMLIKTSDFEENIYISTQEGKMLRQITFDMNIKIEDIKFILTSNIISYIKVEGEYRNLYIYKISEGYEEVILNNNLVYSYTFIDKEKVIVDSYKDDIRGLYLYNIRTEDFKPIIKTKSDIILSEVYYREDLEKVFFIKTEGEQKKLCSIKKDFTGLNELITIDKKKFSTCYGLTYILFFEVDSILFYDLKQRKTFNINYPNGDFSNLKYFDIRENDLIMIGMESEKEIVFYIFNIKRKIFECIKVKIESDKICSAILSLDGKSIIAGINSMGYYNLYTINFDGNRKELINFDGENVEVINRK